MVGSAVAGPLSGAGGAGAVGVAADASAFGVAAVFFWAVAVFDAEALIRVAVAIGYLLNCSSTCATIFSIVAAEAPLDAPISGDAPPPQARATSGASRRW